MTRTALRTIVDDPFAELDEGGYDDMLGYASQALGAGISIGLGFVFLSDEIVDTHLNALPSWQLGRADGRYVHVYRIDLQSEFADKMTDALLDTSPELRHAAHSKVESVVNWLAEQHKTKAGRTFYVTFIQGISDETDTQ